MQTTFGCGWREARGVMTTTGPGADVVLIGFHVRGPGRHGWISNLTCQMTLSCSKCVCVCVGWRGGCKMPGGGRPGMGVGVLNLEMGTDCSLTARERWLSRPAMAKKRGLSLYHIVG